MFINEINRIMKFSRGDREFILASAHSGISVAPEKVSRR